LTEEAIDSISKAIRINDQVPEYYYNLGRALREQGKLEEANASFAKASRLLGK
jgi:tetratricopeptide (TPR) repeat protein